MATRPANSNDEGFIGSPTSRTSRSAQQRFFGAVMTAAAADDMLAEGEVAAAIAAYREAITVCPPCSERGDFQLLLGGILFEQGDAEGAVAEYRTALADGCTYPYEAARRLGFAYAARGDFAAARQSMSDALDMGEDAAFATQAMATYDLALGDVARALRTVEPSAVFAGSQVEYRCRLALVRAELQRLAGNRAAARIDLDRAVEAARDDVLEVELALWLAALDRHFGSTGLRPEIAAAFAAEPDHWAPLAWKILSGEGVRDDLVARLAGQAATSQAENLAIFDRFRGLQAEASGDVDAARTAYRAVRAVPHTQWCIDYHLVGIGLERLEATPAE